MNFNMKKIFGFAEIIRPINFIITLISILVACIICNSNSFDVTKIIFAAIAGAFVGSAGNVINDYFDIEIDLINKPNRPLPANKISKREALIFYLFLNIMAIILAMKINIIAITIVVISIVSIFFYSFHLKKIPLIGNLVVSFFTGLAFVFGGTAVNGVSNSIFPAIFAFLINLIREIVKDMEDVEGDLKLGVITFPAKYGFKKAMNLILVITIILILSTMIPFFTEYYSIEYFIVVILGVNVILVYFLKSIFTNREKNNLSKLSNLLKLIMVIGLIAIYLGS